MIGIDGRLLIALLAGVLAGVLAAFTGFRALLEWVLRDKPWPVRWGG